MIKIETIGMLDTAKNNPVIKSDIAVANHSFITIDNEMYFISNTLLGDEANKEGAVIKAGEFLNGFLVKAWEGQKLVIDRKHIVDGTGVVVGDVLVANAEGKLEKGEAAGIHFVVTDTTVLTEAAVKAKVVIA